MIVYLAESPKYQWLFSVRQCRVSVQMYEWPIPQVSPGAFSMPKFYSSAKIRGTRSYIWMRSDDSRRREKSFSGQKRSFPINFKWRGPVDKTDYFYLSRCQTCQKSKNDQGVKIGDMFSFWPTLVMVMWFGSQLLSVLNASPTKREILLAITLCVLFASDHCLNITHQSHWELSKYCWYLSFGKTWTHQNTNIEWTFSRFSVFTFKLNWSDVAYFWLFVLFSSLFQLLQPSWSPPPSS